MMISPSLIQLIGAVLFGVALLHTFSTQYFEHLAHIHPKHAGIWHLLGEVEVVLEQAFARYGTPETVNTDQGS